VLIAGSVLYVTLSVWWHSDYSLRAFDVIFIRHRCNTIRTNIPYPVYFYYKIIRALISRVKLISAKFTTTCDYVNNTNAFFPFA